MRYKNVVTGAEFESNCEISAPNLIKVGAESLLGEEVTEPKTKTRSAKTVKKGAKK